MSKQIVYGIASLVLLIAIAIGSYLAVTPRGTPSTLQASGVVAQASTDLNTGITVSGQGKVMVKPDIATAHIGVETTSATLTEATSQNNSKMAGVVEKLKSMGVADKDIQTTSYNVSPVVSPNRDPNTTPRITGYRVSNQVVVIIRKIDDVGKLLDAAVTAGANTISGVTFGVDDLKPHQQQAREAAVKDAQDKAGQLAKSAGVQLGPVLMISESVSMPVPLATAELRAAQGVDAVPIQTGELQITVNVVMRFGIK